MTRPLLTLLLLLATGGCASEQWPPPGSTVDYSRCKETVIDSSGVTHHYDPVYNCTEYRNDPNVPPLKQYSGAAEGEGGR